MKIKELNKKLVLKKATVVDLNTEEMNAAVGGDEGTTFRPLVCRTLISACCMTP